jgi:hypothetical protein
MAQPYRLRRAIREGSSPEHVRWAAQILRHAGPPKRANRDSRRLGTATSDNDLGRCGFPLHRLPSWRARTSRPQSWVSGSSRLLCHQDRVSRGALRTSELRRIPLLLASSLGLALSILEFLPKRFDDASNILHDVSRRRPLRRTNVPDRGDARLAQRSAHAVRAQAEKSPESCNRGQRLARSKKGARNLFPGDFASRSIGRHE